jgi:hypothetical protein
MGSVRVPHCSAAAETERMTQETDSTRLRKGRATAVMFAEDQDQLNTLGPGTLLYRHGWLVNN